jgi:hypothetical protein
MCKAICLLISLTTFYSYAQWRGISNDKKPATVQDSINVFYTSLLNVMRSDYVYRENIEWNIVESQVRENLKQYTSFQGSLKEVTTLFDLTNADHCKLQYNNAFYSGNFPGPSKKDFSEQWLKKYGTKPFFEVRVLSGNIGYILMPAISYDHSNANKIDRIAQNMYDEINNVKSAHLLKGWIIDLRFNTGGNCQPMLLALYDFLGDNEIWGVLNAQKEKVRSVYLAKGKYIDESQKIGQVKTKGPLLDKTKVALITCIATGSSGEVTALAFKSRKNTMFLGEETNGKTTANTIVNLPFGAYMTLSTGYDCDRNGIFYHRIVPDISISKEDNFDDLLSDKNIIEGIKFIRAK